MGSDLIVIFLFIAGFAAMISVMAIMLLWARSRSSGVLAVGALFSIFAPDPTFEQKIVMVEKAKVNQSEEDEKDEQDKPCLTN